MDLISRGYRIHYIAEGTGNPIIMLPGLLMSAARWTDIGYVARFALDHRVVAMDPLGHGKSDKPHSSDAYHWADCADDLAAVMDQEEISQAHVWGYSRGANIANVFASNHPERIRSLIIGGSSVGSLPAGVHAPVAARQQSMADALRRHDWDGFWAAMGMDDQATRRILGSGQDDIAIAACIEAGIESLSLPVDLTKLRRPPLVYLGDQEPAFAFLNRLASAVGAEVHAIVGRGHSGAFQDIEAVAPMVRDFLQRDQG
jgi:pimeloyl-ACP methyl ester carboxylesterase